MANYPLKYKQLLCELKSTVEGLLVGQVGNVWFVYGGLNRLHKSMEKIFQHGCKIHQNESYWKFIEGLQWLQPNNALALDIEHKPHMPSNIKESKAAIWLFSSLESHSLSQKLSWLLTDMKHLIECYQTRAFLHQKDYAESVLICLRAVERNQVSLLSEIDPRLFLHKQNTFKKHRRCSSYPDKPSDVKPNLWGSTPNLMNRLSQLSSPVTKPEPSIPISIDVSNLSKSFPETSEKRKPTKSFIEDGGMSVLPMSTCYFPRPSKGQTLTDFLSSRQFALTNAELDRENAHFSISEAIISAVEQMRCRHDEHFEESDEEIRELKQRIRLRRRQKINEKLLGLTASNNETSVSISSLEDVDDLDIDEACNLKDSRGISVSMASLFSESDIFKSQREAPDGASDILSAESVALSLISKFSERQLPRASDLEWLVSEEDAPQALLPMPKSFPISPDDSEQPHTPLRGTLDWAPPRPQIIFTLHPRSNRKKLMATQNFRCAGCGMRVAPQYASKFRYCNYLGRYFCTGCHANQTSYIPGYVLQKWDFSKYPVASFSYRLLEQMHSDPLFRPVELNGRLLRISKSLEVCRKYRLGLFYMKDFVLTCRFAETIKGCIETESPHLIWDPEIYSIQDLLNVRNGEMKSRLKLLVELCCRHIAECELCLARGFICEICMAEKILFPWQFKTVVRCSKCGSCFHIDCWNKTNGTCSRCKRISKRNSKTIDTQSSQRK